MRLEVEIGKKTVIKTAFFIVLLFSAFFVGAIWTVPTAYRTGFEEGYVRALADVSEVTGIEFEWKDLGNGKYQIFAYYEEGLYAGGVAEVHLTIEHWRDGVLLSKEFGAGVLTNIGKDWIEQQLTNPDATQKALYCADSNNASEPQVTWTILPNEITTNGLDRQAGTYTSTGTGTWNVSVTKSVTGTQSTQLWGLHWVETDNSDNNLLAADTGPAQKNCEAGDTLKETWQVSVS